MESLETAELSIENLLDFSSDIGEDDDNDADNPTKKPSKNHLHQPFQLTESDSSPMLVEEEELEWLSNRDAFPPIETSDILCDNSIKNNSPVSVLGMASLQVPVQARSKRQRRRRSNFSNLPGREWWWWCEPKKKEKKKSVVRKCQHCQVDDTPQWRAGPLGPKTLCNACGVRYKSGRLFPEYRPANSPTFSSRLHSNSHRKVLDMRKQKEKEEVFIPQPCPLEYNCQW